MTTPKTQKHHFAGMIDVPDTQDTFTHDHASSDDTHFYVDVAGLGSVCIHRSDDGIIVDIWPLHTSDGPVATAAADLSALDGSN